MLFVALGIVDLIAGGILFFEASVIVKIIAVVLLTKGIITVLKSIQHWNSGIKQAASIQDSQYISCYVCLSTCWNHKFFAAIFAVYLCRSFAEDYSLLFTFSTFYFQEFASWYRHFCFHFFIPLSHFSSNFFTRNPEPFPCFLPHTVHLNRRSIRLVGFSRPFGFSLGKLWYPFILRKNRRWPCAIFLLVLRFACSTVCSVCFLQYGQWMRVFFGYFIQIPFQYPLIYLVW